jgi:cytochrome b
LSREDEVAIEREQVKVWDAPVRLFHWVLVIAVALAFLSSEEDSALNRWHVMAGWVAGILIVFRLIWGFVGGEHSRFSDFVRPSRVASHIAGLTGGRAEPSLGHNPLGAVSVVVLLALVAATVWTGAFGGEWAEELHETIAWTLLAMVGLHVAAVILMSVLERENLARAMVTGRKNGHRHPDAADARPPTVAGIVIAIAAIAATVFGILRYDPQAFTPRSTEAFEHRGGAGGSSLEENEGVRGD